MYPVSGVFGALGALTGVPQSSILSAYPTFSQRTPGRLFVLNSDTYTTNLHRIKGQPLNGEVVRYLMLVPPINSAERAVILGKTRVITAEEFGAGVENLNTQFVKTRYHIPTVPDFPSTIPLTTTVLPPTTLSDFQTSVLRRGFDVGAIDASVVIDPTDPTFFTGINRVENQPITTDNLQRSANLWRVYTLIVHNHETSPTINVQQPATFTGASVANSTFNIGTAVVAFAGLRME